MALPLTTFTINDGAGTPVAQTFNIDDREGVKTVFRNGASTLLRGNQIFTHEARKGKTAAAANRVLMSFTYPKEGTVDGQVQVLNSSGHKVEFNFAPGLTEAERQAQVGEVINTLSQADIKSSIIKVQVAG